MYSTPTLTTRFARSTRALRGDQALGEEQMRAAAPSIFAEGKHASRSARYTYTPTIEVLRGLPISRPFQAPSRLIPRWIRLLLAV